MGANNNLTSIWKQHFCILEQILWSRHAGTVQVVGFLESFIPWPESEGAVVGPSIGLVVLLQCCQVSLHMLISILLSTVLSTGQTTSRNQDDFPALRSTVKGIEGGKRSQMFNSLPVAWIYNKTHMDLLIIGFLTCMVWLQILILEQIRHNCWQTISF